MAKPTEQHTSLAGFGGWLKGRFNRWFYNELGYLLFSCVFLPAVLSVLLVGGALALGVLLAHFGVVSLAVGAAISFSLCLALAAGVCLMDGFFGQNSASERIVKISSSIGLVVGVLLFFALSTWGGLFALPALSGALGLAFSAVLWGGLAASIGAIVGIVITGTVFGATFREASEAHIKEINAGFNKGLLLENTAPRLLVVHSSKSGFCFWQKAQAQALQKASDYKDEDESTVYVTRGWMNSIVGR